jgi:HSP20 family molecular chaperone IbpA
MSIFNRIAPNFSRSSAATGSSEAPAAQESDYTVKPSYRLSETAEAWNLTVQLPGVTKEGLELTAEEGFVTIRGHRNWQKPEGWTQLYRESVGASFGLRLEHENLVDVDKVQAELKDGTLNLTLPKSEALKPRKISIN